MSRRASFALVLVAPALVSMAQARELSFEDRVRAQEAIEQAYWSHRIWPKENPTPKPSFLEVMPESAIRAKVEDYLKKSNVLERYWGRPITAHQLQAEMERIAKDARQPDVLNELLDGLDNDPLLIAECLARPILADRLIRNWYARDERFHGELKRQAEEAVARGCGTPGCMKEMGGVYSEITWRLADGVLDRHTGREDGVVVPLDAQEWGGAVRRLRAHLSVAGEGIIEPAVASIPGAAFGQGRPSGSTSSLGSAVTEPDDGPDLSSIPLLHLGPMQEDDDAFSVTTLIKYDKGRLEAGTVTWNKVPFDAWWMRSGGDFSTVLAAPSARYFVAAPASSGCADDTWTPMPYGAPDGRFGNTAVWTGSEMILWGGAGDGSFLNTGGRYDPATDTWTPTSIEGSIPSPRYFHTAVWTGTEMIVWGGSYDDRYGRIALGTGGRYNPLTDMWTTTSTETSVPSARYSHTAVWTGREMIVWGGVDHYDYFNTGGRYDPASDRWTPTSVGAKVLSPRASPTPGTSYTPKNKTWRKILKLGAGGARIYWRVLGKVTGSPELTTSDEVFSFTVPP